MFLECAHSRRVLAVRSLFLAEPKAKFRFSVLGLAHGLLMGTIDPLQFSSQDFCLVAGAIDLCMASIFDCPQVLGSRFAL
ncbi:hypothetical protein SAMN04488038_101295 [Solimonas aquatica]|uniref:Uncharacterized protein n=1 Tax=Solimonas aquatica TaxID=489703 RepID=A0A1H9A6X2_9GAMM|nr:hypothetical protein [Solimonas aquatica]SEP72404.1 hypothetical protein SAMN04488038_101295 [Solimonas aquatica]